MKKFLNNHTGYITDIGMTGAYNSVIGMDAQTSIERFLTLINEGLEPINTPPYIINGITLSIDTTNGRTNKINRVKYIFDNE